MNSYLYSGVLTEDDPLGLSANIGMFDQSFQNAGRAPVNELFAGRLAMVNDQDWDDRVGRAEAIRLSALQQRAQQIAQNPDDYWWDDEKEWAHTTRGKLFDESGLQLYPGHLRSDTKNPSYMYEFSDENAALKPGARHRISQGAYLGEVLDHDELYKLYPMSKFIPVRREARKDYEGSYIDTSGGLPHGLLSVQTGRDNYSMLGTLLHEIQHYIQDVEGWEFGGIDDKETARQYVKNQEAYEKNALEKNPLWYSDGVGPIERRAYRNLSGEVLARDVEDRMYLTRSQRQSPYLPDSGHLAETLPWSISPATHRKPMAKLRTPAKPLLQKGSFGVLRDNGN
jgi:hypothetical protein